LVFRARSGRGTGPLLRERWPAGEGTRGGREATAGLFFPAQCAIRGRAR